MIATNDTETERRARILATYREAIGRIGHAGICLETLRMELGAIFPATLARMDHSASIAEHAANWFLRMNDGWQAFADGLAGWEAAVLDADATLGELRTRRELATVEEARA